ncbi:hypothetical protein BDW22DRAFT_21761 [Trametopsis cervina]|nr:hypothetical protein BDW22DRAFT_21761 [Trametopsis cervina]
MRKAGYTTGERRILFGLFYNSCYEATGEASVSYDNSGCMRLLDTQSRGMRKSVRTLQTEQHRLQYRCTSASHNSSNCVMPLPLLMTISLVYKQKPHITVIILALYAICDFHSGQFGVVGNKGLNGPFCDPQGEVGPCSWKLAAQARRKQGLRQMGRCSPIAAGITVPNVMPEGRTKTLNKQGAEGLVSPRIYVQKIWAMQEPLYDLHRARCVVQQQEMVARKTMYTHLEMQ